MMAKTHESVRSLGEGRKAGNPTVRMDRCVARVEWDHANQPLAAAWKPE